MNSTNQPQYSTELESRLQLAIATCEASSRRSRRLGAVAIAVITCTLGLSSLKPVGAQGGYGTTLTSLQNQVNTLLNRTQFISADASTKTMKVTGCNLYLQSGSGNTSDNGTPTGLGNLTIGYNGSRGPGDVRSGSHNLIVGDQNNYSSFGGLIAGSFNSLTGVYGSVSGGFGNSADGECSVVSGGDVNIASGVAAVVSGGVNNRASGSGSAISGGNQNAASGQHSSIAGGNFNIASGYASAVLGGYNGTASGVGSSMAGGYNNIASGNFCAVLSGYGCSASNLYSAVEGGYYNNAAGTGSTISGGAFNYAGESFGGGAFNSILGGYGVSNTTQYGHTP